MAAARDVEVFTAFCESHTSQIPFHAVARLLRAATGVGVWTGTAARAQVRDQIPDADPEDVLLLDDLLGIADPSQLPYDRSRCPAAAVGRAVERRLIVPPSPGDLCR